MSMENATHKDHAASQQGGKTFIYYWQKYWDDKRETLLPLHRLHQNSPVMEGITPGDIVWAFIHKKDGTYPIAARFLVSRAGRTPENDPEQAAGVWFFESDLSGLTSFDPGEQDNAEPVIRKLGIKADAPFLGMAFQGNNAVREISRDASEMLQGHVEARAAISMWIAIEQEAKAAEGSDVNPRISRDIAKDLALSAMEGLTEQQKNWVRKRTPWLADKFWKERWRGGSPNCDNCQFDPVARAKGTDVKPRSLIDVHHRNPLQEGHRLTKWREDFALLCPNCHRFEHAEMRLSSARRPA